MKSIQVYLTMTGYRRTTIKQCRDAIIAAHGIISQAARNLGITRDALVKRIATHQILKDAVETGREIIIDKAEGTLVLAIEGGEAWATSLALKTIGKHRGYVERQELDIEGDLNINVVKFNVKDDTDTE